MYDIKNEFKCQMVFVSCIFWGVNIMKVHALCKNVACIFGLPSSQGEAHSGSAAVLCLHTQVPFCASLLKLCVCVWLNVAEGDSWL